MFKKTFPILLLGLALTTGCETLGLGGDDDSDTSTRDDRISRDPVSNRDRPGFEMKYPADFDHGIPSGARLVREVDTGASANYKTPHDGKLYVYDVDSRRVIWSGFMRDGERFSMDLRDNRATIDGQSISNRNLNEDHNYRLYFVEGSRDSFDSDRLDQDRLRDDR